MAGPRSAGPIGTSATILRWLIAVATLGLLAGPQVNRSYPLLPGPVSLQLVAPAGAADSRYPLVVTGAVGAGDLLYLRYLGDSRAVFGYDSWAVGGPVSEPIEIPSGQARPLVIELPSLGAPPRVDRRAHGPLRVLYNGREVLSANAHYYGRQPEEVYFATNPLGGTVANEPFPGAILTTAGQELRGRPTALLPWTTRLRHWLVTQPATAAATVAIAFAAGWGLPFLLRRLVRLVFQRRTDPDFAGHPRAPHGTFLATAAVCVASFSAVITGPSFRLFDAESFGQFYDYQMASLLAGRLDVPEAALSSESFLHDGKFYGYFGPTPALLRLPFALAGLGFGRLSRLYMVLYYAGALIAASALLIQASRWLSRRPTWPGRGSVVVLVGSAGLGSTLFFLGSRAYIYHEAILCGVLFALWSASASLRWLAEPTRHRWWLLALAGGVLSVHSRPPTGLFALGVLGLTAAALLVRSWQDGRRTTGGDPENLPARECLRWPLPAAVGLLAIGGVLSFNVLSYLKFRSFEGAPLRYHVQYHAERLAVTEGRNFHVANVPFGLANYFWRPGLLVRPTFPYVYIDGCDPAGFPGCRIDLAEKTLGLPYAMPALVLLSGLAVVTAVFRWPAARLPTGILVAGVLPMTLALLAAIAVPQRYTGDFVPFLVATGAFGVAALDAWVPAARRNLFGLASVLSVAGMLLTFAITLHYQGEGVWGVPDATRARYLALRHHADHFLGFSSP